MKPLGVNRVIMVVKDLDKSVDLYTRLLGCVFEDQSEAAEPHGVKVALSWDGGIEMCTPLPGRDSLIKTFLEQHGEGLMGVIFSVDDVEEGRERAEKLGIEILGEIEFDQDQIKRFHKDRFRKYKEYALNPAQTCGVFMELAQIDQK